MELLLIFVLTLIVYFLPTIIANRRYHKNSSAIFVLNLLLGWTGLGWAIAAIWAYTNNRHPSSEKLS